MSTTVTFTFITIPEFKQRLQVEKIDIVRNPNSNKLFADTSKGKFKVEQAINFDEPIKFMYETDEKFNEGCIVNTKHSENLVQSL